MNFNFSYGIIILFALVIGFIQDGNGDEHEYEYEYVYEIGYSHGCADSVLAETSLREENGDEDIPKHMQEFNKGYNVGLSECREESK